MRFKLWTNIGSKSGVHWFTVSYYSSFLQVFSLGELKCVFPDDSSGSVVMKLTSSAPGVDCISRNQIWILAFHLEICQERWDNSLQL